MFHAGGEAGGLSGGRTDRQRDSLTDVKKLIVAFRNFANAPKIASFICIQTLSSRWQDYVAVQRR